MKQMGEINLEKHPCFSSFPCTGRIHLPLAERCNISCNFCKRSINPIEERPGVTSSILKIEEAFELIDKAINENAELKVLGVAGPGDPLADDQALHFFELAKEKYPSMIRCMSTNGLLLPEKMEGILRAGIQTLTITINSINPETQAKICEKVVYHNQTYREIEGAKLLINNQLEGLEQATKAGIVVKVNTVLIPQINDNEIEDIAKAIQMRGAFRYNIIPLIPQGKFSDMKEPTCEEIDYARCTAEKHIEVFRHCAHCRADAIGIPGKTEFGGKYYQRRLKELEDTFSHG